MKQWNKVLGIFVVSGLLTAAVAAPVAWAQGSGSGTTPRQPPLERPAPPNAPLHGIVDPAVVKSAIAAALGVTEADLDAAHEAGTTLEALAVAQGVALETVQAAAKAAAIAQINQAVTDGTITQAQADALIAQVNSSAFPLGRPGADHPRPDDSRSELLDHDAIRAVVAETLGITVEELAAAQQAHTPLEELATAHGVTIEAIQSAAKAAAITQINQAVTDGKITQTQADQFIEQLTHSPFPLHGPEQPRPDNGLRALLNHDAIQAVVAETLGITVEDLEAARATHTPLEELATAHGVTLETVQAAAKTAAVAQINQAVTAGKITQAQADQFIEQINNSDFPWPPHPHPQPPANNTPNQSQGAATAPAANNANTSIFLPVVKR